MSNNVVAQFYAEWEREELARNEQSERLKALFAAAKDRDLKPKALRVAFKARFAMLHGSPEEQDKRVAHDEAVEEYLNDLAGVRVRAREIIEEFPTDRDPETGEVNTSFPAAVEGSGPTGGTDVGGGGEAQSTAARKDVPIVTAGTQAPPVDTEPEAAAPFTSDPQWSGAATREDAETAASDPSRRQWKHSDPAHPDCLNPSQCGGFSNFARCDACKAAANMQVA